MSQATINTSKSIIDAMKKRAGHLAAAMEGAEATAMYVSSDYSAALVAEDIVYLAQQVDRIKRSADGIRRALTRCIIASDHFATDEAIGTLSQADIALIKRFAMSPQELRDFDQQVVNDCISENSGSAKASANESRLMSSMLEAK